MNLAQLGLTLAGSLLCAGCIGALAVLLTWRERAASAPERWQRLVTVVLPGSVVLLGLMLWTLLHVMLLWAPGAGGSVAAR
ncbi:hypothetical protein HNQ93_000273 [Hymenobacter luteus]|uniref:Uncharacterized protein n=2 Tax=Hymenobacter TaxID=89966 RepID=A0A7W9WA14_9BACT|nr:MULTISPECIES: hypothetical protein [Hymenobacter]MBB4600247.1 hypothetical protein [Hymenobacter latericoloratus]MBB6057443.1 hypothetical protein [Hymenobacter luteus]